MPYHFKFGTDGWRALIGEDFTLANVERAASAVAAYVRRKRTAQRGVVIGYDTRFLSPEAAAAAAEAIRASGVPVLLADRPTPTPALSFAVASRKAAAGIMISASHNPYRWNGVKIKAEYGGSASPEIIGQIEKHLQKGKTVPPRSKKPARLETLDLVSPYLEKLKTLVSLKRIRESGRRFVVDPMYGAGIACLARLFEEARIPWREIHGERNPLFPGLNPEPIEPHIAGLRAAVREGSFDAGFATDGDADRLGVVGGDGAFLDSHKIFSILLVHLIEDRGKTGEVVRSFSSTDRIDRIARKYGLKVHTTPIGFKYMCPLMLARNVVMAGEESGGLAIGGHLPERDGLLNSLLLGEVMAERGKTLDELMAELDGEFGAFEYTRVDLEVERALAHRIVRDVRSGKHTRLAGLKATSVEDLDGAKLRFGEAGWLLLRASGTENLLRVYAEFPTREQTDRTLSAATDLVRRYE